jgi:hypothetical protein
MQQMMAAEELTALGQDMQAEEARIRPQILRLVGMPLRAA